MYRHIFTAILLFLGCVALSATTHTVARGENLQKIADMYHITVAELVEANPGVQNLFYIGQKLNIPEPAANVPAGVNPQSEPVPAPVEPDSDKARLRENTSVAAQIYSSGNTPRQGSDKGVRIDANGEVVYHPVDAHAIYMMGSFEEVKLSSKYGIGLKGSSISHWGRFHVGADLNFLINAGIVDDFGCMVTFGPSLRFDLADHFFIDMPVNAAVYCEWPEGTTDTKTTWFAIVNPTLHAYFNSRIGIFAGPMVSFDFSGGDPSFGMTAGLTYSL